jgi:LytR cell envelope-related transcriptional attenuator
VAASADDEPVAVASATEQAPSTIPTGTGDDPTDDTPPEPEPEPEAEPDVPEPDAEAHTPEPEPEPDAEAEADAPEPEPDATTPDAKTAPVETPDAETPPVETADAEPADGQEPEAAADTPAVKADFDLPPEVAAVGTLPPEVAPEVAPDAPRPDEEPKRTVDPEALRQRRAVEVRHTLTFLGIFTSVIAVGLVAYTFWLGMWAWPFGSGMAPGCVPGTPTPTAAPVKQTSVRVYNATDRHGLALTVAHDLQKRGFVVPMWDNDPTAAAMKSAAEVRYGPDGLLNARTVAAQVKGTAVLVLDANREGPSVDLVLGRAFTALRSSVEADKLIALPTNVPAVCPAANG